MKLERQNNKFSLIFFSFQVRVTNFPKSEKTSLFAMTINMIYHRLNKKNDMLLSRSELEKLSKANILEAFLAGTGRLVFVPLGAPGQLLRH